MKAIYNEVLTRALHFFLKDSSVISITGAGGKTSLMVMLSNIFSSYGEKVLVSTTTKVQEGLLFDDATCLWDHKNGKCVNPGIEKIKDQIPNFDKVIIEADGSKRLPLKYHTTRDPVVIDETDSTLAVVGLSALGKNIEDVLFGYDEFIKTSSILEHTCDLSFIEKLIDEPSGVLKDMKGKHSFIVFNQADVLTPEQIEKVNAMMFRKELNYLLISIKENKLYAGVRF